MRALRAVSTEKGRDPRDFALVAYGGSGPVHAAALAAELGVRTVIVPPLAGLFSAAGLLFARTEFHDVRFCRVDAPRAGPRGAARASRRDARRTSEPRSAPASGGVAAHGRPPLPRAELGHRGRLPRRAIDAAAVARARRALRGRARAPLRRAPRGGLAVEIRALRLAVARAAARGRAWRRARRTSRVPTRGDARARRLRRRPTARSRRRVVARAAIGDEPARGPAARRRVRHDGRRPAGLDRRGATRPARSCSTHVAGEVDARQPRTTPTRSSAADRRATRSRTVADEMATTIFRTAHSTVVRDAMDFSAALCGPTGETVAQAVTIPLQLGSIPNAMRALLERFGDDLRARRRLHRQRPVRRRRATRPTSSSSSRSSSRRRLIGFAVTVAHHGDVGGRVPGHERLRQHRRLPGGPAAPVDAAVRRRRAGRRRLRDHPRQRAHPARDDRRPQRAGRRVHDRRARRSRSWRSATAPSGSPSMMDGPARPHRAARAAARSPRWPDGTATFTDYLDSDGIDVVRRADHRRADDPRRRDRSPTSRDSAPMVRGRAQLHAVVRRGERLPDGHGGRRASTSRARRGAIRPITVVTKPGTVTHVVMPGASSMRGVTGYRISDAINGALAQLIPHRVPAAGEGGSTLAFFAGRRDGEPFVYSELVVGTWGGAAGRRRQRRPRQPVREHGEHPRRGGRVGLADPDRALRARRRLRRRRPLPRRARGRARLAGARARHAAARALRPPGAPALRPRRRPRRARARRT